MKPKVRFNIGIWGILFLIIAVLIGCNGGSKEEKKVHYTAIKEIPATEWNQLANKIIYFGHQSVGYNIIDGIKDLKKENPAIDLRFVETKDKHALKNGIFAHSKIGKNRDPKSKYNEFVQLLSSDVGKDIDIAMMKFCFVDFAKHTNIKALFGDYKKQLETIKKRNNHTIIVHFTVPLETTKIPFSHWMDVFKRAGWSYRLTMIKNISDLWRTDENIKRNQFNQMMRQEYGNNGHLFDLAQFESTKPDGSRETFTKGGKEYFSLFRDYTDDGGHLNAKGRTRVAEALLIYLVNLQ